MALYLSHLKRRVSFLKWRTCSYYEEISAPTLKRIEDASSPYQAIAVATGSFYSKLHTSFESIDPGRYTLMARLSIGSVCGLSLTVKIGLRDQAGRSLGAPIFRSLPAPKWTELLNQQGAHKWIEVEMIEFEAIGESYPLGQGAASSYYCVDVSFRSLDVCPHSLIKMDAAWLRKL
jgi:hypothetical protein